MARLCRLDRIHLALALLLLLLPLVLSDWHLTQLSQFLTYGLLAASLAFLWGQAGVLSFGHALFFGLGAYAMSLASMGRIPFWPAGSWSGLLLALLLPALVARLLGWFLFHGQGLRGAYLGIVLLALALIAERVATSWAYVGGMNGLMNVPAFSPWPGLELVEPRPLYYALLLVTGLAMLLLEAVTRSRFGLVLRAIQEDERRTAFTGFDTAACKATALTLSGMVAGLAGALFVIQFGFVSPPLIGFGLSTEVLVWTALGGRSLLAAAFIGALAVRWLESSLSEWLGAFWPLALGLLFVLVVVLLPRGLVAEPWLRWAARANGLDPAAREGKPGDHHAED